MLGFWLFFMFAVRGYLGSGCWASIGFGLCARWLSGSVLVFFGFEVVGGLGVLGWALAGVVGFLVEAYVFGCCVAVGWISACGFCFPVGLI